MYALPSTSVRCEPVPPCTNSGYGFHPDQVARAVLLTPPGMVRHALSNSFPLPAVSSPSASRALLAEAAVLIDAFIRFDFRCSAASVAGARHGVSNQGSTAVVFRAAHTGASTR